jgi:hypothetical protein
VSHWKERVTSPARPASLLLHVWARPVPGWLAASFRTRFLVEGYLEEDGEVWDTAGHLVALSRQLAIARGPIPGLGAGL